MGSSDNRTGRLIQDGAGGGDFNMAADVYLARQAAGTGEVILRLYTWEIPTLSLGYHQQITAEQLDRCRRQGVPVVRRPTGGRAVLHDRELTYAVAIPAVHSLLKTGREAILRDVGSVFTVAAERMGLQAEIVRAGGHDEHAETLRRGSPSCFDSASRWEVRLQGRKWIGSAQRFLSGAFLQHGSILLGESSLNIGELLDSTGAVADFDGLEICAEDLRRTVPPAWAERWNLQWREGGFTPVELDEINRLIEERAHFEIYAKTIP